MARLDTLALKAVLSWTKDLYEDLESTNTMIQEELSGKANNLWNITTTILRRDEPLGDEAIELMKVMTYLESTGKGWRIARNYDRFITLSDYNLVHTECYDKTDSFKVVHRLFYDVICERNPSREMDILRRCLEADDAEASQGYYSTLSRPVFQLTLLIPWIHIWERSLIYPELVREFKSIGLTLCIRGYKCDLVPSIAKKTAEIFEELFGARDEQTVVLRSYEFRLLPELRQLNQEDLQKLCNEIRSTFEVFVRSMESSDSESFMHTLGKIYKAEKAVRSYAKENVYFSEDFLQESIVFCMSICTSLCPHSKHIENNVELLPVWLHMAKKYVKKLPRTFATIEFLQELRIMILSDTSTIDPELLILFQTAFLFLLTETVLDQRSSENAKESTIFKTKVNEELNTLLQIFNELILKSLCKQSTEDTIGESVQFMKMAWMVLSRLKDIDGIAQSLMNMMESTNKVLVKIQEVNPIKLREFREYWKSKYAWVYCTHSDLIQTVTTTAADLDNTVKNDILEQCLIFGKSILAFCIHVDYTVDIDLWTMYIRQCCLTLNGFEEYEKFLLENTGNHQRIAECMIEFGYKLSQKLKLDSGTQDCGPLIHTALESTEKYFNMLSDDDSDSFGQIKNWAMETIEFCINYIKEDH